MPSNVVTVTRPASSSSEQISNPTRCSLKIFDLHSSSLATVYLVPAWLAILSPLLDLPPQPLSRFQTQPATHLNSFISTLPHPFISNDVFWCLHGWQYCRRYSARLLSLWIDFKLNHLLTENLWPPPFLTHSLSFMHFVSGTGSSSALKSVLFSRVLTRFIVCC